MQFNEIKALHNKKRNEIESRLESFKNLREGEIFKELLFCLLTPQSSAKSCWSAVQLISKIKSPKKSEIANILKTRARFHNNKAKYIMRAHKNWGLIKSRLNEKDIKSLRNWLAENVSGLGYKEASHFLRNIGLSGNKIAILDRHILRNLKNLGIINDDNIKSRSHYINLEQEFIRFSKSINIPLDNLDLLFWSKETGEIFK